MIRHVSLSFSLNPADSNHVQPQVSPLGWWLPSGGLSSSSNQRLGLAVKSVSNLRLGESEEEERPPICEPEAETKLKRKQFLLS